MRKSVSLLSDTNIQEIIQAANAAKAEKELKTARKNSVISPSPARAANQPFSLQSPNAATTTASGVNSPTALDTSAVDIGRMRAPNTINKFTFGSKVPTFTTTSSSPSDQDRSSDKISNKGDATYGIVSMVPVEAEPEFDVIEMLETGRNSRSGRAINSSPGVSGRSPSMRNKSRGASNAEYHRKLSMSGRGPNALISPHLLTYVRSTFLSMVRVK